MLRGVSGASTALACTKQPGTETIVDGGSATGPDNTGAGTQTTVAKPSKPLLTQYDGTVKIDPRRVNKEVGTIVQEIIERLASQPGTEVEITLEINARRTLGFDDATVNTVKENSRTLRFNSHEFEGDLVSKVGAL